MIRHFFANRRTGKKELFPLSPAVKKKNCVIPGLYKNTVIHFETLTGRNIVQYEPQNVYPCCGRGEKGGMSEKPMFSRKLSS